MPKIRSILIRNFRSIRSLEFNATDLTTIVGDNDSGKSNILRALNLFFNRETDPGIQLDFDNDFNKYVALNKQAPQIDVEITLELPEGYHEMNGHRVRWRKSWRREGLVKERDWIGLRSEGIRRGRERFAEVFIEPRSRLPALLSRIEFEYVPAIRGADFIRRMRGRIYRVIADVAEEGFRLRSGDFEQAIGEQVEPLMASLLQDMSESASLKLPNDLSEVFEQLDFLSGEKAISLNSRGDGIKGRYVPHILKFIAEKKQQLYGRGAQPYTFIWAYEEPENNLEFRRAQELANFFYEIASDQLTQVLVTTHSPIFFNLKNDHPDLCTTAFVTRLDEESGTVAQSDLSTLEALDERMGVMTIIAPHIRNAAAEIMMLRDQSVHLQEQLDQHNIQLLPSIFVEGVTDHIVLQRVIDLYFPKVRDRICMLPPPVRAGAGYVSNMLQSWEFKTRTCTIADRRRAHGFLDCDDAGMREHDKLKKLKAKHVDVTVLTAPEHLNPAIQAGFKVPICLEEQYPVAWWAEALGRGWLCEREPTQYLTNENLNRLARRDVSLDDLFGDADWKVVVTHCVNEANKTDWATWVSQLGEDEFREGTEPLATAMLGALTRMGVVEN
ncbi:ATP-dependent nuclease [Sphingobium subterraneum]|uniref:Energy-coupling factor transporter ATP-binding protein EcfA2 n=1 Tax=Sphingobium subterraneum TaxID=627688 RepID=A0A841J1T0_9SPHN|nr:AAA family ATPase [Sphingobium subterraneum]MBB6124610.1 energy-coupling factor transporter ATP-binding protein EcfA2 [Sphingobium subterraneum]